MLPSVWPGDVLTIESAAHGEIVPGDIVLVMRDNRFFVHRLVETQQVHGGTLWITRGDAMPHDDPPATESQLLGRVAGIRCGNRSLIPSRQVSPLHFGLAWMLCRWDRFRNLALNTHAASLHGGKTRAGEFFRGVLGCVRGVPESIGPTPTSHP
jgi:magnesium-transporting ATPase (P-type)